MKFFKWLAYLALLFGLLTGAGVLMRGCAIASFNHATRGVTK